MARESSPSGSRSTLMTSAPKSPRTMVAYGPASTRVRSRTVTPASGRDTGGLSFHHRDCHPAPHATPVELTAAAGGTSTGLCGHSAAADRRRTIMPERALLDLYF